jgi:prepilin-type N-terminal cleavage/methylation domain-containing protein
MLGKIPFKIRENSTDNANNSFVWRRGFTLVETIVSIGLLALVLSAFIGTIGTSLRLTELGNKRYIASKIAQEGMELFQSKRNNNVICIEHDLTTPCDAIPDADYLGGEKDWRYALYEREVGVKDLPPKEPFRTNQYEIDGNVPSSLLPGVVLANFDSTHYLCQQSSLSDRFNYCGDPTQYIPGNFTREIRVDADPAYPSGTPAELPLRVQVVVSWSSRNGIRQSLNIEKHLFNTQP